MLNVLIFLAVLFISVFRCKDKQKWSVTHKNSYKLSVIYSNYYKLVIACTVIYVVNEQYILNSLQYNCDRIEEKILQNHSTKIIWLNKYYKCTIII